MIDTKPIQLFINENNELVSMLQGRVINTYSDNMFSIGYTIFDGTYSLLKYGSVKIVEELLQAFKNTLSNNKSGAISINQMVENCQQIAFEVNEEILEGLNAVLEDNTKLKDFLIANDMNIE